MLSRRGLVHAALLTGSAVMAADAHPSHAAPAALQSAKGRVHPQRGAKPDAIGPLVDHALTTPFEDIPAAVLAVTRQQLLDILAVGLAGQHQPGVVQLRDLAKEIGGRPESVVWGSQLRLPSHDAARINATMAHALEFDDTFERGFLHPSAVTFPAAFAVADQVGGVSGKEFLAATTLAVDVACRLASASQPGVDGFAAGWHYTTLFGYLTSALLAARIMKLDRATAINAVGLAAHQAAGNAQSHIDAALAKRMGPGFASACGVYAARLAARGVTGPDGVLEGDRGFFRQYHRSDYSRDALLGDLGKRYLALEMSFKPWPSCRGSHTSADAALQLLAERRLQPRDIHQVIVSNGPSEWPFLSQPIAAKRRPASVVEAQFSIPWVVAAALSDSSLSLSHFTPAALEREDIRAMADRIETIQDDSLATAGGGVGAARIMLLTTDGRTFSKEVAVAKGGPQAPMSTAEIDAKFADCIAYAGLSLQVLKSLRQAISDIEKMDDIARLTGLLHSAGAQG